MISAAKRFIIGALQLLCRKSVRAESFLIPAYTGLGNFLLMSPMIRTLRERYPASRIYILAGNAFGGEHVFRAGDGIVDDVFFLPMGASGWNRISNIKSQISN